MTRHAEIDSSNWNFPELTNELRAGKVSALIILDANPVYTAPADLDFSKEILPAFTVHCGSYFDETAAACAWHIPQSHFLESWGDLRALDRTFSIVQPLIEPLYPTKTSAELLAALRGESASLLRIRPGLLENLS